VTTGSSLPVVKDPLPSLQQAGEYLTG